MRLCYEFALLAWVQSASPLWLASGAHTRCGAGVASLEQGPPESLYSSLSLSPVEIELGRTSDEDQNVTTQ